MLKTFCDVEHCEKEIGFSPFTVHAQAGMSIVDGKDRTYVKSEVHLCDTHKKEFKEKLYAFLFSDKVMQQ